jgi:hypothetical protein
MVLTKSQKLTLVQLILEQKDILLARFSPTVTRRRKTKIWINIRESLLAMGADSEDIPDIASLRDKIWPNLRKAAMVKAQDQAKTGATGGRLSEMDDLILNIIGRESPMMKPVDSKNFPVTFGDTPANAIVPTSTNGAPSPNRRTEDCIRITQEPILVKKQSRVVKSEDMMEELTKLRIEKLKIDLITQRLTNRKLELEIERLESLRDMKVMFDIVSE